MTRQGLSKKSLLNTEISGASFEERIKMPAWPRTATLNSSSEETFECFSSWDTAIREKKNGTLLWKSAQTALHSACSSPAQTHICNYSPSYSIRSHHFTEIRDTTDRGAGPSSSNFCTE